MIPEFAVLSAALVQGLVGSLHCAGMCGPLVAIASSTPGSSPLVNLTYQLARLSSYAVVGGLIGAFGHLLDIGIFRGLSLYLGGALIILVALSYLLPPLSGTLPAWLSGFQEGGGRLQGWLVSRMSNARSAHTVSLLFGLVSALLPCGLLHAAYGLALAAGSPLLSAATMFAFGLGTSPTLLGLGLGGQKLQAKLTPLLVGRWRAAFGAVLLVVGLLTIYIRFQHKHEVGAHAPQQHVHPPHQHQH